MYQVGSVTEDGSEANRVNLKQDMSEPRDKYTAEDKSVCDKLVHQSESMEEVY